MSENKQALQVAALKNGTVIDHIPSEKLFTVVQLLGVEQMTSNITIGFNLVIANNVQFDVRCHYRNTVNLFVAEEFICNLDDPFFA